MRLPRVCAAQLRQARASGSARKAGQGPDFCSPREHHQLRGGCGASGRVSRLGAQPGEGGRERLARLALEAAPARARALATLPLELLRLELERRQTEARLLVQQLALSS